MSAIDQEESIMQYYLKASSLNKKLNSKSEPNGQVMTNAIGMFKGMNVGQASTKDTVYVLLCSITEFVTQEFG